MQAQKMKILAIRGIKTWR